MEDTVSGRETVSWLLCCPEQSCPLPELWLPLSYVLMGQQSRWGTVARNKKQGRSSLPQGLAGRQGTYKAAPAAPLVLDQQGSFLASRMEPESRLSRGIWGGVRGLGRGIRQGTHHTDRPRWLFKTGTEPFSGREIWPLANVNTLAELMHRTLIPSSSARWRYVWEKGRSVKGRVCEWIPNTFQIPRKLRAHFLLHGGNTRSRRDTTGGQNFSVLTRLRGEDVG